MSQVVLDLRFLLRGVDTLGFVVKDIRVCAVFAPLGAVLEVVDVEAD